MRRLRQMTQFERVEAPFQGVITARNIDNGDLVKADDNSGGTPLFTIQRDDIVRVQVNVPQSGAVGLQDGLPAEVRVPELPSRTFEGKVSRNSVALDAASRTMLGRSRCCPILTGGASGGILRRCVQLGICDRLAEALAQRAPASRSGAGAAALARRARRGRATAGPVRRAHPGQGRRQRPRHPGRAPGLDRGPGRLRRHPRRRQDPSQPPQTLAEVATGLDPARFERIHRSYVLNIERLARLELTRQGPVGSRSLKDGRGAAGQPVGIRAL